MRSRAGEHVLVRRLGTVAIRLSGEDCASFLERDPPRDAARRQNSDRHSVGVIRSERGIRLKRLIEVDSTSEANNVR